MKYLRYIGISLKMILLVISCINVCLTALTKDNLNNSTSSLSKIKSLNLLSISTSSIELIMFPNPIEELYESKAFKKSLELHERRKIS